MNQKTGKSHRLLTEVEWEYAARGGKNLSSKIHSDIGNLDSNRISEIETNRISEIPTIFASMQALKTFICYAHEDRQVVDDLREHLAVYEKKRLLDIWYDGKILAGEKWDDSIKSALRRADLVLLFVSVKFINSEYIEKAELQEALTRHRTGEATLIPIIVSSCDWEEYFELGKFQALPNQAVPILSRHFPHKSDAYHEVAIGVKQTAQNLQAKKQEAREKAEAESAREAERMAKAAEAEKIEKARSLRDDAFWKRIQNELARTEDPAQKLTLLDTYLKDEEHRNHREAAEKTESELKADIAAAEKIEAAQKKREEDAEKARKAAEEKKKRDEALAKAKKEEEERKKREAEKKKAEEEQKRRENDWEPEMVFVKGGTFTMGSPANEEGRSSDEVQHPVTLSDFYIAKYPVTQKLWKAIMGDNPSHFKGDDLPVEKVSWDDCQKFIQKLNQKTGKNYRLPTEAEWEYAARGGILSKGYMYAGSNNPDEVAWHLGNAGGKIHPVGQKKANELGLFDMNGNVWEWCGDWYDSYPTGAQNNPTGPKSGSDRVYRGGSWGSTAQRCRVAYRLNNSPGYRYGNLGFRLVSPPQ